MLSTHYPLAFATEYNWVIASLVFLMGVSIRHYFNSKHAGKGTPNWTWLVTALLFIAIVWLSTASMYGPVEEAELQPLTPHEQRMAAADGFDKAHEIVLGRCSMCHSREPYWEGIRWAPKGVLLETKADVARNAKLIYLQSGVTHAMPPANITMMGPEDRAAIVRWFRAAQM